jgi:hypothetical protein
MEIQEHAMQMMIQHEHVVRSLGNVQIEQHHEAMDMLAVMHDVDIHINTDLQLRHMPDVVVQR